MKTQSILTADSREQTPLVFRNLPCITATLQSGDYSVRGLEHLFTIERKSIADLIQSVTTSRPRFERELHRLRGFQFARVLIIGKQSDLSSGNYRSKAKPKSVLHSIWAMEARYNIPFVFSPTPATASILVERWAYWFHREIHKAVV